MLEIHKVREWTEPAGTFCEQVDDDYAPAEGERCFWSLYRHVPEGGVECLADFPTREAAVNAMAKMCG